MCPQRTLDETISTAENGTQRTSGLNTSEVENGHREKTRSLSCAAPHEAEI